MIRLVVLDSVLPSQLQERPEELDGIEVAWAGSSLEELRRLLPRLTPAVLVLSLELLGEEPQKMLHDLQAAAGAELVLTLYRFARRDVLSSLEGDGRRLVKAPVSVGGLRTQMMGVLVRNILHSTTATSPGPRPPADVARRGTQQLPAPRAVAPAPSPAIPQPATPQPATSPATSRPATAAATTAATTPANSAPPPTARLYSDAQLGRLAEIKPSVLCECPNHVAGILQSLVAFEDYARQCESRDDEDAAVHRALGEATANARAVMEGAMARLLRHERIDV